MYDLREREGNQRKVHKNDYKSNWVVCNCDDDGKKYNSLGKKLKK
jgi:hypothetical protein